VDKATTEAARRAWDRGDYLAAGRLLYECLAVQQRPPWAAAALIEVHDAAGPIAEIENLIVIAHIPDRWPEARQAFDALRQLTLKAEKEGEKDGPHRAILYLAENVAKVTFNALGFPASYDDNAGWQVVSCLGKVLDSQGDAARRDHAWEAISTWWET
jgi:hypothetical protein